MSYISVLGVIQTFKFILSRLNLQRQILNRDIVISFQTVDFELIHEVVHH